MIPNRKTAEKSGASKSADKPQVIETRSSQWVRAPQAGLMRIEVPLGSRVEPNQIVGRIADSIGENETLVESPVTGIIIGRNNLPVVNEGDALFHIALFDDSNDVKKAIDNFQDLHIEGLDPNDYPDSHVI